MEYIITSLITAIVTIAGIRAYAAYQIRKSLREWDDHCERQQELEEQVRRSSFGAALRVAAAQPEPHVWYEDQCANCGGTVSFIAPRAMFSEGPAEGYCATCGIKHPVTLGDCNEVERIDG